MALAKKRSCPGSALALKPGSFSPMCRLSIMVFAPRPARSRGLLVDRHDARAAQPQVVLQCDPGAFHLPLAGVAAQLLREFEALGEPGSADRVALGEQAARGVDDPAPAEGVVAVLDQLLA